MSSLLKDKFPKSKIDLICLNQKIHRNEKINAEIVKKLTQKNINLYLGNDIEIDQKNFTYTLTNRSSADKPLKNVEFEFLGFSSFRKWPSFLSKSNLFEEEFCKETLRHTKFPDMFALGNLIHPSGSLFEKFSQAQICENNLMNLVNCYDNTYNQLARE